MRPGISIYQDSNDSLSPVILLRLPPRLGRKALLDAKTLFRLRPMAKRRTRLEERADGLREKVLEESLLRGAVSMSSR
jgi:hypothetical protein